MDVEVVKDEEEDVAVTSFCHRYQFPSSKMVQRYGSFMALGESHTSNSISQ